MNWYADEHDGHDNPIAKVSVPKVPPNVLEPVRLDDLRAMRRTCPRRAFHGDRAKAILLALLDTGCRRVEFLALDVGDVNLRDVAVLIRHRKGNKPRVAFVGAKVRRAIVAYLRHRQMVQDADALWVAEDGTRLKATALRAMLQRRAGEAGVPVPSPHMFQRGFALNALRAGVALFAAHARTCRFDRHKAVSSANIR